MKYLVTAVALAMAAPAGAGTLGAFSDLIVFGDSLSDPGNVSQLTQGTTPNPDFYPNGQFTNGDTWAVQLGSGLGSNFAFGGARAVENGDAIPDLNKQVKAFSAVAPTFGENPLAAIWTGGNDLRDITVGIATQTLTPEQAFASAAKVARKIARSVKKIAEYSNVTEFLVFSVPDISVVPSIAGTQLEGFAASLAAFTNNALDAELVKISELRPGVNIEQFDTNAILRQVLADPSAFGVSNTSGQCLIQTSTFSSYCGAENAADFLFFDDLHPTEGIHTLIADAVRAQIDVVPLPGGLSLALGGFALLGFAARRKRAA